MSLKTYAIIGAIVVIAVVLASKLMKYEITTTTKNSENVATGTVTQSLKSSLNIQKEA